MTQKAKHTPGPWELSTRLYVHGILDSKGLAIAFQDVAPQVDCGSITSRGRTPEETLANARLIAAAPDLLEALEALKTANGANNFQGWHSSFEEAIAKANAAIAKAKGE